MPYIKHLLCAWSCQSGWWPAHMLMLNSAELLFNRHRAWCLASQSDWVPMAPCKLFKHTLLNPQGDPQLDSHADWDAHSPQHNAGEEVHIGVQATLDKVFVVSGNVLKLHCNLQERIIPAIDIRCAWGQAPFPALTSTAALSSWNGYLRQSTRQVRGAVPGKMHGSSLSSAARGAPICLPA